jgi:hypothetical protein
MRWYGELFRNFFYFYISGLLGGYNCNNTEHQMNVLAANSVEVFLTSLWAVVDGFSGYSAKVTARKIFYASANVTFISVLVSNELTQLQTQQRKNNCLFMHLTMLMTHFSP